MNYGESSRAIPPGDAEVYSLKWQTFQSHLTNGLKNLFLESDPLTDVTLASEGRFIKTHKLILSLCSPYFKNMFQVNQSPNSNMIVVINNVTFNDLENLVHFIYNGEVKVKNTELNGFLQAGELLQIEGLASAATDTANAEEPSNKHQGQESSHNNESGNTIHVAQQRTLRSTFSQNSAPNPVRVQTPASYNPSHQRGYPAHYASKSALAHRSVKRAKFTVQSTSRSVPVTTSTNNSFNTVTVGSGMSMRIPIEEVETDPLAMSQVIIDEMIDDPLADHDPVIRIDSIKSEGGPPIYLNENSDDFEPVEAEAGDIFTSTLAMNDDGNADLPGPSSAISGAPPKSTARGVKKAKPRWKRRGVTRPVRSTVWDSFTFKEALHKSACNLCGYLLSGKNTSNLRNHLKFKHHM